MLLRHADFHNSASALTALETRSKHAHLLLEARGISLEKFVRIVLSGGNASL